MVQDVDEILEEMDVLWRNFVNCRAHFPYVSDDMIGQTAAPTAPYYLKHGFNIYFSFEEPLSKEIISRINEIGHWINQNFVVRLCALLESHHVLSNQITIDPGLQGADDVDIIRRLRNYFAHSSGKYNPSKDEHRKTLEKIGDHLGIDVQGYEDFPVSIAIVLEPLFNGCKTYVKAKFAAA